MHIFHHWIVIYRFVLPNNRGWFEHGKCKKCDSQKIIHKLKFFSTISDAIDLGVEQGVYAGIQETLYRVKFEQ